MIRPIIQRRILASPNRYAALGSVPILTLLVGRLAELVPPFPCRAESATVLLRQCNATALTDWLLTMLSYAVTLPVRVEPTHVFRAFALGVPMMVALWWDDQGNPLPIGIEWMASAVLLPVVRFAKRWFTRAFVGYMLYLLHVRGWSRERLGDHLSTQITGVVEPLTNQTVTLLDAVPFVGEAVAALAAVVFLAGQTLYLKHKLTAGPRPEFDPEVDGM